MSFRVKAAAAVAVRASRAFIYMYSHGCSGTLRTQVGRALNEGGGGGVGGGGVASPEVQLHRSV